MPRILVVLAALTCALATLGACSAQTSEKPVRILVTGDSFVQGFQGDYTWRYWLGREFKRQGVPVNFVGTWWAPKADPAYPTPAYAKPFDDEHFAAVGWPLRDMVGRIGAEVATQKPEVVVLEAGINDITHGTSAGELAALLRGWLTAVHVNAPDAKIVLAQVSSVNWRGDEKVNATVDAYNDLLADIAADAGATVAHTQDGWSNSLVLDGTHPTPTGETHIAQRVAQALHEIDVLPEGSDLFHTVSSAANR